MKEHIKYIDTLRVVATIAVIFIHVASMFISAKGLCPGSDNLGGYGMVHSFWAVDIFLMISGVLLLGKSQPVAYGQVFGRYIPRVLWALLLFALPMCIAEQFMTQDSANLGNILITSVVNFLTGHSWTHMWYLYMLLGLYLIVPVFHSFVLTTTKKDHTLLAVALAIITIIIPNISMIAGVDMQHFLILPSFLGVFYLGFYLSTYCPENKATLLISLLCLSVYAAYSIHVSQLASLVIGPDSVLSIVAAGAVFCIIRQYPVCSKLCSKLAPHCFCIYLIHPVFLNVMFKILHIEDISTPFAWLNMLLVVAVSFSLSLGVSFLLRKIPFLRNNVL